MTKWCLLLSFSFGFLFSNAQETEKEILFHIQQLENNTKKSENLIQELEDEKIKLHRIWMNNLGFPSNGKEEKIIHHLAYSLHYNENHEQADWVMHVLSNEITRKEFSRTIEFSPDTLVESGTAIKEDYITSEFDLGHLAPSADFKWSTKILNESYLYSNISPQASALNRGTWKKMEILLRNYVTQTSRPLMIVTGPVLEDSLPKIGVKNNISVPRFFYKAALDFKDSLPKGIAFILPNANCIYPPLSYSISIDSLEKIIGYELFPKFGERTESNFDLSYWQKTVDNGNLLPIGEKSLPENTINTAQAKLHVGNKMKVCGTVVSEKYNWSKNSTFYEWDRKFPDRMFTLIFENDDSTTPTPIMVGNSICVEGIIDTYLGIPSITIHSFDKIEVVEIQYNK